MFRVSQNTFKLVICLLLLYMSWGSSFLGNKFALESFPGFLLTGLRFSIAGFVLLLYTYLRGERTTISLNDFKYQMLNGFFMVLIASGLIAKGQEFNVPSGMAAILYGASPIWLMLSEWWFWGGDKPSTKQIFGLGLGFGVLVWLNIHQGTSSEASIVGLLLIMGSTFAWVYGSHFTQKHKCDSDLSVLKATGLLLFFGGLQSLILSYILGERVDFFNVPISAYLALLHLIVFSSIIAYSTYIWLLFNSRAIVAISYEYIVPVIALLLGAFFANEKIDSTTIIASALLILSVCLVIITRKR